MLRDTRQVLFLLQVKFTTTCWKNQELLVRKRCINSVLNVAFFGVCKTFHNQVRRATFKMCLPIMITVSTKRRWLVYTAIQLDISQPNLVFTIATFFVQAK